MSEQTLTGEHPHRLTIETVMVAAPPLDGGTPSTVEEPAGGRSGSQGGASSETSEWAVVRVDGELDLATGPELRSRLIELVDEGVRHVVLDLSTVPFLDSAALGIFVTGLKRLRIAGGTMRLAGCRPSVGAVLKITSLDRVFFLYASVEAALADETGYLPPAPA